jgi:redox-sensitive bicupin YhaK (pirin superfamily)
MDSMGNSHVIRAGEIQVMSAGKGIEHAEHNESKEESVNFLQIWIFPKSRNVEPRYDQQLIDTASRPDELVQILSPESNDAGVWIHQDAWFHRGRLTAGFETEYAFKREGNGLYVFVLDGSATVAGETLKHRDGLGIEGTDRVSIKADTDANLLLMEVPMQW